jgi:hypothetical protein
MRTLIYGLVAAVLIAIAPDPARADTCSDLKEHPLAPLTFVPFNRTNPDTGKPYGPSDQITVSDTTMNAIAAFDALDALERQLTAFGYTLRDIDEKTLAELGSCPELLASQVPLVEKILSDKAGPLSPSTIAEKIQRAIDLAKTMVPNWGELYDKITDPAREVYLPPVPTYSAPVPQPKRTELKPLVKERSWSWDLGEKKSLWVQLLASFRIDGSKTAAKAAAKGQVNAAVLGLWEGEALGADATASVGDGSVGSLAVNVRAIGKTVFSKSWTEGVLKQQDEKRFDVHPEWSFRFAIGPVPCKGTIGFMGSVGVKYGFQVVPIQISAFAVPFAATKVFAQVGADIVVAGAGVGGEVTLINDDLTLQGSFSVTFEDQPSLVLELSGKIYAYVYVKFLFIKWKGTFTIYSWTGFKKDSDIFKFRTTWGPDGVKAEGDLTAEDVMQVKADQAERRLVDLENASNQRVFEVFDAIARDLNSAASAAVTSERTRHAAISQGIDATIAQYRAALNQATGGG